MDIRRNNHRDYSGTYFAIHPRRYDEKYLCKLQIANWMRLHDDVLEAGLRGVSGDAREIFVEPDYEIANKHDVIAGVHGRVGSIAIPKFPDSGRAL